ncbi:MAG: c-type cytochrome [Pseudomonadota bacterium]
MSFRFLPQFIAVLPLLWSVTAGAGEERFNLGVAVSPDEIREMAITVMPDGRGLPVGEGSVAAGEALYAEACANCHGEAGQGGPFGSLTGEPSYSPAEFAANRALKKTIGNYWPYATSVFDYIRRAMPFDRPGSLTNDEAYAVTGYLLHLEGLLGARELLDRERILEIKMPAQSFFVPAEEVEEIQ